MTLSNSSSSSSSKSIFLLLRLGSWVFKWAFMLQPRANLFPHLWHSWGFCPEMDWRKNGVTKNLKWLIRIQNLDWKEARKFYLVLFITFFNLHTKIPSLGKTNFLENHYTKSINLKHKRIECNNAHNIPVCRKRWFFKLVTLLNPRSQIWHRWGQLPLWMYMWDLRSPGVGKDFWHSSHLWGFSCN